MGHHHISVVALVRPHRFIGLHAPFRYGQYDRWAGAAEPHCLQERPGTEHCVRHLLLPRAPRPNAMNAEAAPAA